MVRDVEKDREKERGREGKRYTQRRVSIDDDDHYV